ncbi:hypothetical protein EGR_07318 [Echinococcus granulosus]|uniref:Uncharacterized protein n=1 Tax=Echinococcus granulosus TaxID=6210 RepID=W6UIB7_ECHGR|nr:hypothetical protein EGR_07318 [Echinococcus granulosus]EUB57847.1 hypothetical protein EGR_07318 [Echinococcus granulosus]
MRNKKLNFNKLIFTQNQNANTRTFKKFWFKLVINLMLIQISNASPLKAENCDDWSLLDLSIAGLTGCLTKFFVDGVGEGSNSNANGGYRRSTVMKGGGYTGYFALHSFHISNQPFHFFGYYRRFVEGSAEIVSSLRNLTKNKANNFMQEKDHNEALKEPKRMLCSARTAVLSNFESNSPPFALHAEAGDAVVGVYSHKETKKEREQVMDDAGPRLSKRLRQSSATELSIRYFYNDETLQTLPHGEEEYSWLTQLKMLKELNRSVEPWYLEVQQYDFTIQCRKGNAHCSADALYRRSVAAETDIKVLM